MKDEKLYRRYTVRLFPTPEQEELMWKHVHAARFVWNYMLDLQNGRYKNNRKHLSGFETCGDLKYMKMQPEMKWLKEVANGTLQQVCVDLDKSFRMFFGKIHKKPKYKSKKYTSNSFPLKPDSKNTYFSDKFTFVMLKVGEIKCKHNYVIQTGKGSKIIDPRVKYIKSSKKWILTFSLERDKQTPELTKESMGIDLGIKELAVIAVGDKKLVFHNINKSKRMRALEKKKRHIKRAIDRKYRTFNGFETPEKGQAWKKTKQIEKYEQILREIETKMANIRHNYIHQTTRRLANMLPECVVMEDLVVSCMKRNKYLSKSISEQNFYFFIQTMKYKCEEYGIEFVQADRYFPSSKTCSCCGHVNKNLKLKDRTYKCPICGLEIDRDYNAAINLMNYTEKSSTTAKNLVDAKLLA